MKLALVILAALLAAMPTLAQEKAQKPDAKTAPAFEFRGHRIGEPVEKVAPKCHDKDEMAYCSDDAAEKELDLLSLWYKFLDGKLISIEMKTGINKGEYASMLTALKTKYGEPAGTRTPTEFLRGPETFWIFREGVLVLSAPAYPGDLSYVRFRNPTAERTIKQRKDAEDAARARKF